MAAELGVNVSSVWCPWSTGDRPRLVSTRLSSSPDAADSSSFDVELGDIILTASDGLFDNMPDYMILRELKKLKVPLQECRYFPPRKHHLPNVIHPAVWSFQAPSYDSVLQTAQSIAQQAHDLAYDPNYMSPFAQFACDNGLNVRGTCIDSPVIISPCISLTFISLLVCLDLQEGSRMTSQCCCPLWLNIQTEHVCQYCWACVHACEAGPSIPSAWVFHLQP